MNYHIDLYKHPNTHNFSKNPIPFGFNISPFGETNVVARQRIYVTLLFSFVMDNPQFEELWSGAVGPDKDGIAMLDISSILDAKLKFYTPNTNLLKFHKCTEQCGVFKLRYYLADNNNYLSQVRTSSLYHVYKGGVAKEDFDNDATYLNETLITDRAPLHFYHSEETVRITEPKWLYFIYKIASVLANEMVCYVTFFQTDGWAQDIFPLAQTIKMIEYQVYCVPVDIASMKIEYNAPDFNMVYKYSVLLQDQNIEDICAMTFFVDWRPFYDEKYLLYRNSLGALETQALLGEKEFGIHIDGEKTETVPLTEMMGDTLIQREQRDYLNTQNALVKANTGWIPKVILMRLKDLLLNKQVWSLYGNRLKPVHVSTSNTLLQRSSDKLYSLAVDYSNAYEDENYNPEGMVVFSAICPAVEFIWGGVKVGGKIWVKWQLPPGYDKIQFSYFTSLVGTVILVNYSGNSGIAVIDINSTINTYIQDVTVTLKARCVCNDEVSPFSYGVYTGNLYIDLSSLMPPITTDDVMDIGERNLVGRILKQGGLDYNVNNNDITLNGGYIGFENIFNATGTAVIGTSQNGAIVQQLGTGGMLIYTPTPTSIANLAQDVIHYKCNEIVFSFGFLIGNLATIIVPLKAEVPKVYAKLIALNWLETEYKYGFLNLYKEYDITCDLYIQFFKDAACTIPVDVSTYGITIGWKQLVRYDVFNSFGGVSSSTSYALETSGTVSAIGNSMLFKQTFYTAKWDNGASTGYDRDIEFNTVTTVGNVVAVGW